MRALLPLTSLLIFFTPLVSLAQENVVTSMANDIYVGGPAAPVVESALFRNPDAWYKPSDVTFTWGVSEEVTAVAAELVTDPKQEPQESYRPPISELEIVAAELREGVSYLNVQLRNNEKWGEFTSHQIKIDATAPEEFDISVTPLLAERPAFVLSWEAVDYLSGIDHYTIEVNNNEPETLTAAEVRSGYLLDIDPTIQYEVTVSAYDQAGNERSVDALLIPTTPVSVTGGTIGLISKQAASLLVAVMSAIMLLLFGYLIYERQRYAHQLHHIKKEANDIHEQLLRIFTALREEIHDQIRGITSKKRLNKGEKEAVDGLNKALSVSEMLLEREVQDVKKLADQ